MIAECHKYSLAELNVSDLGNTSPVLDKSHQVLVRFLGSHPQLWLLSLVNALCLRKGSAQASISYKNSTYKSSHAVHNSRERLQVPVLDKDWSIITTSFVAIHVKDSIEGRNDRVHVDLLPRPGVDARDEAHQEATARLVLLDRDVLSHGEGSDGGDHARFGRRRADNRVCLNDALYLIIRDGLHGR